MTTEIQLAFLRKAYSAALISGHIFPGVAAAEAALESAWGTSGLALKANNLFGLKKAQNWLGQTVSILTREYLSGKWITVPAQWPVFASWQECIAARMATLNRVGVYADALKATTPEEFITRVSAHWATDPDRATKVLAIYHAHPDILAPMKEAA